MKRNHKSLYKEQCTVSENYTTDSLCYEDDHNKDFRRKHIKCENQDYNKEYREERYNPKFKNKTLNDKKGEYKSSNRGMHDDLENHKYEDNLQPENDASHKSKTDSQIKETSVYFEKILSVLADGVETEFEEVFARNVLQESTGNEVELCCQGASSHCIELLLLQSNDPVIYKRFMHAFSQQKLKVCTAANASHVTELLLYFSLQDMQTWYVECSDEMTETSNTMTTIDWIKDLAKFCIENFDLCTENISMCHILSSLIRVLGGHFLEKDSYTSEKVKAHKEQLSQQYTGWKKRITKKGIMLEKIPKCFMDLLIEITVKIEKLQNLQDFVNNVPTAIITEVLLFALKERKPKMCKAFIKSIISTILEEKDRQGIPFAFLQKTSSYVIEKIFEVANEKQQQSLWLKHFANCIKSMILHPIGNHVVQRLLENVASKSQLELMLETMHELFDQILESHRFGIFVSIAKACIKHNTGQAEFMKNMFKCLECAELMDCQNHLIPLLLGFQKYENYIQSNEKELGEVTIFLQGSLLVQQILQFQKPIKVVRSILNMKPQKLLFLASHTQGCHVFNAFFQSSTVGRKNKDKFIQIIQPIIPSMVANRDSGMTLCRIWKLLTIKQKSDIVEVLLQNQQKLLENQNAYLVCKKFGVFYFKNHYNEWEKSQKKLSTNMPVNTTE